MDIVDILRSNGIPILSVNEVHAARLEHLPLYHRDPFDRLLIAQAQIEGLTLVTADRQFSTYDVALV
ncbi:type II toxin-antitoxin system VapC family toxin [Mesorhizobium sp. CO1-1-8]|nr:type II toxin-antitoxin system VapC family toxin [Mesorhizobium sp. CO1-1-8]